MKKYIILLTAAIFCFNSCGYNTLKTNEEDVSAAWLNVEVAYQERTDLIPPLIETVKKYASNETSILDAVSTAELKIRSLQNTKDIVNDSTIFQKFQGAQGDLSSSLSRLMVTADKNQELKTDQQFAKLKNQLEIIENRLNNARVRYNQTAKSFNTSIEVFPNNITNIIFLNHKRKNIFNSQEGTAAAVKINSK